MVTFPAQKNVRRRRDYPSISGHPIPVMGMAGYCFLPSRRLVAKTGGDDDSSRHR